MNPLSNPQSFFAYAALITFLYYLFARAEITSWLWSRYPNWLDRLAMCPACSGAWLGLIMSFRWESPLHYGDSTSLLWCSVSGMISGFFVNTITFAIFDFALTVPSLLRERPAFTSHQPQPPEGTQEEDPTPIPGAVSGRSV